METYRGFGTKDQVYLSGRVYLQLGWQPRWLPGPIGDVVTFLMRWLRWGRSGVKLVGRIGQGHQTVFSDRDGYFVFRFRPGELDGNGVWHRLHLEIHGHRKGLMKTSEAVYVAPEQSEYVVISDLDDTIMFTGVANKLKMFWRLFMQPADTRVAFPGAVELYSGFHKGSSGEAANPMLYVSRAPWSIYDVLTEFFRLHEIPEGPILLLREWGMSIKQPWPNKSVNHKYEAIRQIMEVYEGRRFVLIGDSGQRDPEIYARIVRDYPNRVQAVYIRDVSDEDRSQMIKDLSREIFEEKSQLLLAHDSKAMAVHAASIGLIRSEVVPRVIEAQQSKTEADH